MSALPECRQPADCYGWLSATSVMRHALAAYYRACRECEPPAGEAFDGWADRSAFVSTLVDLLTLRIHAAASAAGVEGFELAADQLARWDTDPAADPARRAAAAATSPQRCADADALDLDADRRRAGIAAQVSATASQPSGPLQNRFFAAPQRNGLPVGNRAGYPAPERGEPAPNPTWRQ